MGGVNQKCACFMLLKFSILFFFWGGGRGKEFASSSFKRLLKELKHTCSIEIFSRPSIVRLWIEQNSQTLF